MNIAKREIPFFNYSELFRLKEERYMEIIREVGRRGAFIMQKEVRDFENNLAEYIGAKHVLGVANATDGLHLALRAIGIGEGDEVIFSSHTMVATAAAIHFAGAIPIPVECGKDHLMDPDAVERAITEKTKAIMPTQLNGRTCNMDALQKIADKYNLFIVEDAAQGLGSRYKGKCAGTFGIASAISFYPAKVLGCLGDGGVVITNDDSVYHKLFQLRDHGKDSTGEVVSWGFNSRLDNMHAAILNDGLKTYHQVIERRRKIASVYQDRLVHLAELVLPPAPDSDPFHFDIYQNYEIEADRRDELQEYLRENGVGTHIQWGGKAVHQFAGLGFDQSLPYVEHLFSRMIMLPINMFISDEDIHYICDSIIDFYKN